MRTALETPLMAIADAVTEYGKLRAVDTSRWTTTLSPKSCVVSHIESRTRAEQVRDMLAGRGLTAEVLALTPNQADWAVVAVLNTRGG